jgi:hypothetical protein
MKPIKELELTPEEEAGVQKYRDFLQARRREGHLRRWYAEVDRLFPDNLDAETRHELADSMFRNHMAETTRSNRAKE